jgi:hypothetical protein
MSRTHPLQIVIGRKYPANRFTPVNQKPTLTKAEALQTVKKISRASTFLFENVVLLIAKKGYVALGFEKPQDCLRKKIPTISNSYICRLLQATEIYLTVDPDMEYLNLVSESTFRPLQHISDKECKAVWNWVLNNTIGYRRITSRDVNRAMDALGISSHENCVSVHQPSTFSICISEKYQPIFRRYIERISDTIMEQNTQTQAEWKLLAKLIYQEILDSCPHRDYKPKQKL